MEFTKLELDILYDTDFLLTKVKVLEKVNLLLENTRDDLQRFISKSDFSFPKDLKLDFGKFSKGENYKLLPYMVLDFPSLFSNKNIFAFRTMFWWGNFFSATMHLEGEIFEKYKPTINKNVAKLFDKEIFICVAKTPWQYHYEESNYILLTKENHHLINEVPFLKLSTKIELPKWENLSKISVDFFELVLSALK